VQQHVRLVIVTDNDEYIVGHHSIPMMIMMLLSIASLVLRLAIESIRPKFIIAADIIKRKRLSIEETCLELLRVSSDQTNML
jgi:hypothetical protein